ncbi:MULTISPECIES: hypothetical protein [Rhodopseudomonas]|uniref:Uncharacterized protein n=1 Tax=Rhodopseudomonas palustris TaxID=1076 RepID=A0A0D7F2T3_RHOPL|nr:MULTISPECIES: hypothetical protein [Rhodopseudomonas]KIZ47393.1 hypothetical protein OO17_04610 [Rhodopseudomonas palustris]MDF3809262.1 hypothetical protein [Rhodopseudomonas sp. BAL398]WOK19053.1 hypothetical protein RBJ75_05915 [Rhodopseudomonas sp. BAL398]
MTTPINHLNIMNNALARIGGGALMDEDEDTDLAAQVKAVYYDRVDAIFGLHHWSFSSKTFKLDALAAISENGYDATASKFITGWKYAFQMPGTRLSEPRKVMTDPRRPDDPFRDFFVEAGVLYADRAPIWASFTVRSDPAIWPPLFRLAVTTAIAADLCVPVTHDKTLAQALQADAEGMPSEGGRGGLLGRAMGKDLAGAPVSSPLSVDPLTSARHNGGAWHGRF